jgi:hypothetical protein
MHRGRGYPQCPITCFTPDIIPPGTAPLRMKILARGVYAGIFLADYPSDPALVVVDHAALSLTYSATIELPGSIILGAQYQTKFNPTIGGLDEAFAIADSLGNECLANGHCLGNTERWDDIFINVRNLSFSRVDPPFTTMFGMTRIVVPYF